MDETNKNYNPKDFETRIYEKWVKDQVFTPSVEPSGKSPFVVEIPPPNVTGVLHMGHGLNMSLQDILIRYKKLTGHETLWLPGTDHAGIATQSVVERELKANGEPTRQEMGREKFVERVWKTKETHHTTIKKQMEKLGVAVDWSRERFTLDPAMSKAVSTAFVELYNKGLIYRGEYLVNWDPSTQSAISDEEVEHKELMGALYHITYPLADGSGSLEIATTRPETLFGDVAVAVNPNDERYKSLVGKTLKLPLTTREIPIITDNYVETEFGTGAVKITPAHDPNDFDMGNRHNLERINILNPDGTLNERAGEFQGLSRMPARKAVVKALKEQGFLVKEEPHKQQVGHCDRTGEVIEPYLSTQWFVRMQPMAEKGLKALADGDIHFYPKHWENTYTHWMGNIRDWCISRQLWWGHRIPIWYDNETNEMVASLDDPSARAEYTGRSFRQEEDVLDTWFSSWLWPFSTMGWPEKTPDLARFYPGTAVVTGYDIIFFWIARMVMAGLEFMGEVPFKDIYITPLVRDKKGRKMSKSLGNGIDPLEVIDLYGSDALKFTIGFLSAQGQDLPVDLETFKFGSKFANKVWNASRFILSRGEGLTFTMETGGDDVDTWFTTELDRTVKQVATAMEAYRFNDATKAVYEFFWETFCDWYVEIQKIVLNKAEKEGDTETQTKVYSKLVIFLGDSLKLLHPFLPFLTEELWSKLPNAKGMIVENPYPAVPAQCVDAGKFKQFEVFKTWITGVRTLRSEFSLSPVLPIKILLRFEENFAYKDFFVSHLEWAKVLLKAEEITVAESLDKSAGIGFVGAGFETQALIKDLVDLPKEMARLTKSRDRAQDQIEKTTARLENAEFRARAPESILTSEAEKVRELTRFVALSNEYLIGLSS